MARTGGRAEALQTHLVRAGLTAVAVQPARPTGDGQRDELLSIYRRLGGLLADPAWRPGSWDIVFDGGLVVELDEELHFNRYRAMTLDASWASDLPWTDEYRSYCADFESECLSAGCWGKRWTNDSSGRMFSGGPARDLVRGAPRWKQRALYDALKDTTPVADIGLSIARVSIFDRVEGVVLDDVLKERVSVEPKALLRLVSCRTAH